MNPTEPQQPIMPPVAPPVTPPPAPVAPQPAATITPGANTMPVAPLPEQHSGKRKFNMPDMKEIIAKIKALPLKYKIMGGFVGVLLLLLILVAFTGPGKKVKQLILPSPSPIPTLEPVGDVSEPSAYANDPEVLELENQVNEFDAKLGTTDLREDSLRIPNLDWDINFKNN